MERDGVPSTRAIAKVFLTVAALAIALYLVWVVRRPLLLVFIAGFVAVALGPPVDALARRGLHRAGAILAVYVALLGAIVGVGLLVVPPVVSEVQALARDAPGYIADLRKSATFRKYDDKYHISRSLNDQVRTLPQRLGQAAGALQSVTVGVFSALVQLVTVLTMAFFLLLDGSRLVAFLLRLTGRREARYRVIAGDIYNSVAGYVAGNLVISVVAGLVAYLAMVILGVPFAVPLAVLMAFLDLIPLVGATLGGAVIALVTLFNGFPTTTIVWLIVFVVYQQVENNVLQPVVYRRTVNVPPLAVIVAILIGSELLGVLGALIAIPIAAAVQIVLKDMWLRTSDEPSLTHGDPLQPQTAPAPEQTSPADPGRLRP
jgi:predicted PurR-regulated permease PerM